MIVCFVLWFCIGHFGQGDPDPWHFVHVTYFGPAVLPKERPGPAAGVNKTGFIKDLESWRHDQNVDNESSTFDLYFLKYKNPSSFNFLSLHHEIICAPSGSFSEWATKFVKTALLSIRIQIRLISVGIFWFVCVIILTIFFSMSIITILKSSMHNNSNSSPIFQASSFWWDIFFKLIFMLQC